MGGSLNKLVGDHPRKWGDFDYVYPVVSRRSAGLSIGINLNVDAACNFDCVYCQVDRTNPPRRRDVDLRQLADELDRMLALTGSGEIWRDEKFAETPGKLRRINDIAFSGDGEPTAYPRFGEAMKTAVELRDRHGLRDVKLVLITNATLLDRPAVRAALQTLDEAGGEVWAKLDAGTESFFQMVDRPRGSIMLRTVLDNIADAGRKRALVIQSLWMKLHGQPPPKEEFEAYLDRLAELRGRGCRIDRIQLYTIARRTAEPWVTPLEDERMDALGERLRGRLPDLRAEVYYGAGGA